MSAIRSFTGIALLLAVACDPGSPQLETRTFGLDHLSGMEVGELIRPYVYDGREGAPGAIAVARNAVTVRETADNLDRIALMLEEFDRPSPTVRLQFQVIEANGPADPDPAIADVEEELRRFFRFEGYRLVGETSVTASAGGSFRSGPFGDGDWRIHSGGPLRTPSGRPAGSGDAATNGGTIRLEEISLWAGPGDIVLETSVNIHPGQTLVLGNARVPGGEEGEVVILAVRAELIER